MILPEGWEQFYDDVCRKVKILTKVGVWSSDASSMLAWLGNFEKREHKYIAAHILDRLTFRSEKMLESSYRLFLCSTFRNYVLEKTGQSAGSIQEWLSFLAASPREVMSDLLVCSVSKAGEHGESGSHMIRILTGELINEHRVFPIDTDSFSSVEGKVILIVDDFVGSGKQFSDFAEPRDISNASKKNHIIYAPAMGFEIGLENLKRKSYGIEIFPLEVVGEHERFFCHQPGAPFVGDDLNSESDVLKCYHEMRTLDKSFKKPNWLGRNKASLCVAFQWGCPNQSLGVMWFKGDGSWNRLVRRRGIQ
jgi:hypothetical protein